MTSCTSAAQVGHDAAWSPPGSPKLKEITAQEAFCDNLYLEETGYPPDSSASDRRVVPKQAATRSTLHRTQASLGESSRWNGSNQG